MDVQVLDSDLVAEKKLGVFSREFGSRFQEFLLVQAL